jgi:hypothetical protein
LNWNPSTLLKESTLKFLKAGLKHHEVIKKSTENLVLADSGFWVDSEENGSVLLRNAGSHL